jgi:hypothetical protein
MRGEGDAARGRNGETAIRSHTGGVAFEGCKVEEFDLRID